MNIEAICHFGSTYNIRTLFVQRDSTQNIQLYYVHNLVDICMTVINMNMIMNNRSTCIMKDFGQIIILDESQTTKTSNYKTGIYFSNMHKDQTNQH